MPIIDFTYKDYLNMLELIQRSGYSFSNYHNYKNFSNPCIMRHDIDIDMVQALRFARLETEFCEELKSIYFVLLSSNFYNVFSKETLYALDAILELGHEIGLHFDEKKYNILTAQNLEESVQEEAFILGRSLGIKIKAVSMHRPSKLTLEADYSFEGLENCISNKFVKEFKYLSDSRMHWREDAEEIIISLKYSILQILTHAFWYSDRKETIREKLLRYIKNAPNERYDFLSDNFRDLTGFVLCEEI